jgi:hypothetical protein
MKSFGFRPEETRHWSRGKARRVINWCLFRACYMAFIHEGRWPGSEKKALFCAAFYERGGEVIAAESGEQI